jgi:hypothetical protein
MDQRQLADELRQGHCWRYVDELVACSGGQKQMKKDGEEKKKKKMTRIEIKEAIDEIERCYGIGKDVLKKCTAVSAPGVIAELAAEHGVNRDKAQKLRAMAAKETGYASAELKSLYQQFRKAEFALTISHFVKLVSVPKGKVRDKLTTETIENRWSTHWLQTEIVARLGRRQVGGRKPNVAMGDEAESELTQTLWSWNRWMTFYLEANTELGPDLSKAVKSVQNKIIELSDLLNVK